MQTQQAVGLVQAASKSPDTELAHFTKDELGLLDAFKGGQRDLNPSTGLPQYGWLGNLLKGLVRAGATIGGGLVAGPAGAAAGAGIGTKLTGGSWSDALKGAAISGIGSFAMQGLSGAGWSATAPWGQGAGAAAGSAAGTPAVGGMSLAPAEGANGIAMGAAPGVAPIAAGAPISTAALSPSALAPSGLGSQFLTAARSAPGIAASLGALSQPFDHPHNQAAPTDGGPHFSVTPLQRLQTSYQGDPLTYGQRGGHKFYDEINPPVNFVNPVPGGVDYAKGGQVQHFAPGGPVGYNAGAGLAGPTSGALQQAAMQGYMAAKKGGAIAHQGGVHGPGGPTDDLIDAKLSNGEHVATTAEIDSLGGGDNDLGQQRMYRLRKAIRQKGPAVMRGIGKTKIAPRGVKR